GQALRVRDMIGDVMLYARARAPRQETLDLSAVLTEVTGRFQEALADAAISLQLAAPSGNVISADPTQLRVVISELVRNAINAQPSGGSLSISCEQCSNSD